MKTTSFLASMLFGSLALAAPMNKRALHTSTSTVVQTEVVYTTVYDGELPGPTEAAAVPSSSSSAAAFFEEPTSSPVAAPTIPPPPPAPTSVKTSAVVVPTPSSSSSSSSSSEVPSSSAAPTTTAAPTPTAAPVQPSPTSVVAQPAPAPSAPASSGSGDVHSGGSMTLNYFSGGLGSCGKPISDDSMTVALASDLYGPSTYDVATGNPTNKWCGKTVAINYNGKTTMAKIMDKCPGCTDGGFDMTPALWEAVTGTSVGDRRTGMTWTLA